MPLWHLTEVSSCSSQDSSFPPKQLFPSQTLLGLFSLLSLADLPAVDEIPSWHPGLGVSITNRAGCPSSFSDGSYILSHTLGCPRIMIWYLLVGGKSHAICLLVLMHQPLGSCLSLTFGRDKGCRSYCTASQENSRVSQEERNPNGDTDEQCFPGQWGNS